MPHDRRHESIARAQAAGLVVVLFDGRTLQLDCDTAQQFDFARHMLDLFAAALDFPAATVTRSKSSGWHIHVTLKNPVTVPIAIALQAALGSDPVRELHNVLDYLENPDQVPLLFERPDARHDPI